ncbi:poly(A)-specific ribonuclease PNLDC1-like isoform X2 [Halichondria panicea]
MEERYQKLKRFGKAFTICQFGLSAFRKDPKANKYVAHTFNFYLCPRPCGDELTHFTLQASNVAFLCEHKFNFNKMMHQGIGHLNSQQVESVRSAVSESELEEAIGFSKVFQLLVDGKKPLMGHNMLNDLALMYEKFHGPLPEHYDDFKQGIHNLFPVVIDTKNLCFALRKRLYGTKLIEFTSLMDLYEALGSQRGTYYALCSPEIVLAEEAQVYSSTKAPHEAGFDAYCVGYVFLRLTHLAAMKGVESSHAHPVHLRQYFRLVGPFTNKVNLIRGPINCIDLGGPDPAPFRSQCLSITRKDGQPLTVDMLHSELEYGSMDIRFPTDTTAHVILSTQRRADELLLTSEEGGPFHVQVYTQGLVASRNIWKLAMIGVGVVGIVGLSLAKLRTYLN